MKTTMVHCRGAWLLLLGIVATPGCVNVGGLLDGATDDTGPTASEIEANLTNTRPVAVAGDDQIADTGELVVLNAAASSDADGDNLMFVWAQTDGDVDVQLRNPFGSVTTFEAPEELTAAVTLTFTVTVIDGAAASADQVVVTINP
ncbi:MAG: hypothetical protein CHACPFDD_00747 [Phycisphaerae bacterium]|nr:hypothetical protein [Phycisphaerae bacterium]